MIPAGNYVMWIEDVAGAVIQKREITLGEPVTRETMVADATGHTEWLWPEEVLRARESRLLYAYCLALGLLSPFIMVVSHLVAAYVPKPTG